MLNTNKFCYMLVPLPPMRTTPISIYSGEYPTSTSLAYFNHVKYPFDTLPTVTSHIYPHYVVYDTGKKLAHFFGEDLNEPRLPDMPYDAWVKGLDMGSAYLGVLKDCHTLYSRWMAVQPPPSFLRKGPDVQKLDENEGGKSGSGNKRWRGPTDGRRSLRSKKRSRTDVNDSGGHSDVVLGSPGNIGSQQTFDNVLTPSDSVSCHNLLQYDDSDVGNTVGVGDRNDGIDSEASILSFSFSVGIEAWRQSVRVAGVEGHVQKQVEDTNAEDERAVGRGAASLPSTENSTPSESIATVDHVRVAGEEPEGHVQKQVEDANAEDKCAVGRGAASPPSTENSAPSITMVDVGANIGPKDRGHCRGRSELEKHGLVQGSYNLCQAARGCGI
jgi:hypothetical protein